MTTVLMVAILILQLASLSLTLYRKTPSIDLLKKDILILEKNIEIIRSQMIVIITKNNLDSNSISLLEELLLKTNKSDNNFH